MKIIQTLVKAPIKVILITTIIILTAAAATTAITITTITIIRIVKNKIIKIKITILYSKIIVLKILHHIIIRMCNPQFRLTLKINKLILLLSFIVTLRLIITPLAILKILMQMLLCAFILKIQRLEKLGITKKFQ